MTDDRWTATREIDGSPEAIFAVLADPAQHVAIDGTGWVSESLDPAPLTATGQVFRIGMYHENHPDGHYEMANRVEQFDAPNVIAWKPGQYGPDGTLGFGGWVWRYDLDPADADRTTVTLTYDWSAVPDEIRRAIGIPPFPPEHLDNSLAHLAELV